MLVQPIEEKIDKQTIDRIYQAEKSSRELMRFEIMKLRRGGKFIRSRV